MPHGYIAGILERMYQSENSRHRLRLWERLEFLSPSSPRFEPASRDRVSDTICLEARLLTVALAEPTGNKTRTIYIDKWGQGACPKFKKWVFSAIKYSVIIQGSFIAMSGFR